jgi:hypothetical protein
MFIIIVIQMMLTDVQVCLVLQHYELFWDPPRTDFMKPTSVVDDSVCRTMTDLHTICHFTNSHSSVEENHVIHTLSIVLTCSRGWATSVSVLMCNTYATNFFSFNPFTDTVLWQSAVPVLC